MALQEILQKILDQAQKRVEEIQQEIKVEKELIDKEYAKLQTKDEETVKQKYFLAVENLEQKMNALTRKEKRKLSLNSLRKVVQYALDSFVDYLCALDDKSYTELVKKMLEKVSIKTKGKIIIPKDKLALFTPLISENLEIETSDDIKGGFILKLAEAQVDNSFENIVLSEYKGEIEEFFAKKLGIINSNKK